MSSTVIDDPPTSSKSATPKPKKNKKKNKKGKVEQPEPNGDAQKANGVVYDDPTEEGIVTDNIESQTPTEPPTPTSPRNPLNVSSLPQRNGIIETPTSRIENRSNEESGSPSPALRTRSGSQRPQSLQLPSTNTPLDEAHPDSEARFEALAKERETLREEVVHMRKSLEEFQKKHKEEVVDLQDQLVHSQNEKEEKETQYRSLLGKVNTIRSQLGDRLKADAEDLAQARSRIEELEEHNSNLQEQNEARETELATLAEQGDQQSKELSGLRNRILLSQQNFEKEREDLVQRETLAKDEFEAAKQAMQEWEILATEERSIRQSVQDKTNDLEEQMSTHREAHEKAIAERDEHLSSVERLHKALQELQETRRRELRESVENSQAQIEGLQRQLQDKESILVDQAKQLKSVQEQLERALPFEKEVNDKNVAIGKLRHEGIILKDHLTKALRYLKKGKPEDTIDKQLVTNHLMHFIALDRADPKKFQVLQIIAGLLAWTDEQREQAGLARPGASNPNLRVPISPWHRTPSTPSLNTDLAFDNSSRKESLAELWSEFLEQEAAEGVKSPRSPESSAAASSSTGAKQPP